MSLLPGMTYEPRRGELGLLNPQRQPADDAARELAGRFLAASESERQQLRKRVSEDDFYLLMRFSERCSVFALRNHDAQMVREGLAAVALVPAGLFDPRDFVFSTLPNAAERLGLDGRQLLEEAADLADPPLARALRKADWRAAGGRFVETQHGAGLLSRFSLAGPEVLALLPSGVDAAEAVERDGRYIADVEGEDKIPGIWIRVPEAQPLLAALRPVLCIHAKLAPGSLPKLDELKRRCAFLAVWVARAPKADHAQRLAELAGRSQAPDALISGVAEGSLFALASSRTALQGAKPVETAESLHVMTSEIRDRLRKHA